MAKSTVIIPNYNGIKYIEACLESLYADIGDTDTKVIVVDNASKDGSLELIKEKFQDVILIENTENTGFAPAVNQGILASDTAYCILLNNDTVVEPGFIAGLEKAIEADDRIFSASAKLISLHDKDKLDDAGDYYCALGWAFALGKGKSPAKYHKPRDIFASCGGAAIYRRDMLLGEVGLFDDTHFAYLEDIDLGYRAKICGYRNVYAPGAVIYHAGSATSGSRYNHFKTKLASRNSIYIIYKNMPLLQLIINLPLLILGFLVKTLFFIKKGMGRDYLEGLRDGFRLSASREGHSHKVRFRLKNLGNYLKIQLLLWRNIFYIVL